LALVVIFGALACSEGPEAVEVEQALAVVDEARERFPVLVPFLERAASVEPAGDRFRSAPPADTPGSGSAWRKPGNHRIEAELPAHATGVMRLSNGPVTLEVRAIGASDVPGVPTDNALVYRDAYPHADSFITAETERVEEFIVLRDKHAPRRFEYEVRVVRGGGRVRQLEPGLPVEVLDGEGNAWLRLEDPWVEDSEGERHAVEVALEGGRLVLSLPEQRWRYPLLLDPVWTTTGSMAKARSYHRSVLLKSGKVLVVGGSGSNPTYLRSAELYDANTGTWTATGSMAAWRAEHTATLLPSGKVFAAAGKSNGQLSSAELYNPATGNWTKTASLSRARDNHTATLLKSGKVLITGGGGGGYLASAELYDPATAKWTTTGSMTSVRIYHTAVLLNSGKVLVAGGKVGGASAELYDPATAKWTATGSMKGSRYRHTATMLSSGKVLVAGGSGAGSTAELYDPTTGTWAATGSTNTSRTYHTSTLLWSGGVLFAGGIGSSGYTASAEQYDPVTGTWTSMASMIKAHRHHAATLLKTGLVLVAGGRTGYNDTANAELFNPSTGLSCSKASECVSGYCVDGVCCQSACKGTCKKCTAATSQYGTSGKCADVPLGKPDLYATTPCSGNLVCDGKGMCKLAPGQPCTSATQCASGFCADGVCCDGACSATCKACNLTGKAGTCSFVPLGKPDKSGTSTCTGSLVCDGQGMCKLDLGQTCAAASQCATGHCVDGVCCGSACQGTCTSCGQTGSKGTCKYVPVGQGDALGAKPCTGFFACDGAGGCKTKKVTTCTSAAQCPSGFCVDGWCCHAACTGACKVCNLSGLEGFCANVPVGKPDLVGTKPCTGKQVCNGKGSCLTDKGKGCTADSECLTGHCADGYCCDAACTGTCQACNLPLKLGTCSYVAVGQQDQKAATPCKAPKACDGKGGCFTATGKGCKAGGECVTGSCSDKYCCDTPCTGTCYDCGRSGLEGKCSPVPSGQADTNANVSCMGTNACDGAGSCKRMTGSICTLASQCLSGYCSDGYCCDTACTAACLTCALPGSSPGSCVHVSSGQPDKNAATPCTGKQACDGNGSCKKNSGETCKAATDCLTGYCVDGYCCNTSCKGTCRACDLSSNPGTCGNLPKLAEDKNATVTCTGTQACDGNGTCKAAVGQLCSNNSDCANATCNTRDKVCCQTKCDAICRTCSLDAKTRGTCQFLPKDGKADKDCIGKDPKCGGECDGSGGCDFPDVTTTCGACKACDGTGKCNRPPKDDTTCGTIDCDKLDTKCRDYHDLTTERCDSFGKCKAENDPKSCTLYTDTPCGDAAVPDQPTSAKADQGQGKDEPAEEGCSCQVGGQGAPWAVYLLLLSMLGIARRRQ